VDPKKRSRRETEAIHYPNREKKRATEATTAETKRLTQRGREEALGSREVV